MRSARMRGIVLGVLATTLAISIWFTVRAREGVAAFSTPSVSLYALDATQGLHVQTLNAATLKTVGTSRRTMAASGVIGPYDHGILTSADGSTLLALAARQNEYGPPAA